MSYHELSGPYVADGALAIRGGRYFVAWKKPGESENTIFEIQFASSQPLREIGKFPAGGYYKEGSVALAFDDATGELCALMFPSKSPDSGDQARPILWKTGLFVEGADAKAIAALDARLDKIASGAQG